MKNNLIGLLLLLVLVAAGCKKKAAHNMNEIWDCHASQAFDSTKLAKSLIGSWKWKKMSSELIKKLADKNVIVTFCSNGIFTVTENSLIATRGNWRLKIVDRSFLGLSMDSASKYLYGRILLCDNELLFNNSYVDGSDNYFTRTK